MLGGIAEELHAQPALAIAGIAMNPSYENILVETQGRAGLDPGVAPRR